MTQITAKKVAQVMRQQIKGMPRQTFAHVTVSCIKNIITVTNMHHMDAIDLARQCCPNAEFKVMTSSMIEFKGIKETQKPPIAELLTQARTEIKEAYYGIGDKISGLEMLAEKMEHGAARYELGLHIEALTKAHSDLKKWADRRLPNWD